MIKFAYASLNYLKYLSELIAVNLSWLLKLSCDSLISFRLFWEEKSRKKLNGIGTLELADIVFCQTFEQNMPGRIF